SGFHKAIYIHILLILRLPQLRSFPSVVHSEYTALIFLLIVFGLRLIIGHSFVNELFVWFVVLLPLVVPNPILVLEFFYVLRLFFLLAPNVLIFDPTKKNNFLSKEFPLLGLILKSNLLRYPGNIYRELPQ